jgi:hypothetical protein
VLRRSPARGLRGLQALASIGLRPRLAVATQDFADPSKRAEWIEHPNVLVFPLSYPSNPLRSVDVFIDEPMAFEQLLSRAATQHVDGVLIPIACIEPLIEMKQRVNRPRDRDDIDKLQQIRDAEPKRCR